MARGSMKVALPSTLDAFPLGSGDPSQESRQVQKRARFEGLRGNRECTQCDKNGYIATGTLLTLSERPQNRLSTRARGYCWQ